eukprot:CAMPEP_0197189364 /NCGR_PEP_ID=MMETSP1423-20130617/19651_1 /TAXON_ID=476441 /ORGANISM="Pseudo-nitzschia heimii, Strain UNC1101" /LENGTH=97 /DNA_ID=CAMNT_0042641453 /DNA_START=46 /DNA_END=336 /DNA_ORIENTATION=-
MSTQSSVRVVGLDERGQGVVDLGVVVVVILVAQIHASHDRITPATSPRWHVGVGHYNWCRRIRLILRRGKAPGSNRLALVGNVRDNVLKLVGVFGSG